MEILTHRLRLTPITKEHLLPIHDLHAQPETDAYNTLGIPKNSIETAMVIQPWITANDLPKIKNYTLAITLKKKAIFIGLFGLKLGNPKYNGAEVWYKIHPKYWNNGYATEALKEVLNFGFNTLKLHRIEAGCAVANLASIKVLEKVGMLREGRCRKILPLATGWADNFEYAILSSDPR